MTQKAAQSDTFSCEPVVGCGLLVPGPPFSPVRSNIRVSRWWDSCAFWCVCGRCAFEKNSKVVHFSILLLKLCFCVSLKHVLCPLGANLPILAVQSGIQLGIAVTLPGKLT